MKYLFFIDRHDLNISRHFWPIYMETGEWRHSDWSHRQLGHWTDSEQREVCVLRWYFPQLGDIVVVLLCWATLLAVGADWLAWMPAYPESRDLIQKLRAMTCCGSRPSDSTPARSREVRCQSNTRHFINSFMNLTPLSLSHCLVNNFPCGSRNYLWFCFKGRSISFWHSFVVFFQRQIRSQPSSSEIYCEKTGQWM